MALKYVQTLTLYQAGAGNIIGATSVVLVSLTDIYGNAITTMAPFGTKGYITLEPDTSNEEGATFTGITVNANGTVSLTGVSTILAQSPYTETSGLVRTHSGGTKVVITDNVGFWNTFANKNNDETVVGKYTFPNTTNRPQLAADTDTVTATELVTLGQLSRQAISGAANASTTVKGLVELATQAEIDARTTTGGSGALLVPTPDTTRSTLLSDYKVDTGAANAYVITPVPAITAYVTGQQFSFKAVNANTAASTLNVNALGVKTIKRNDGTAANDVKVGDILADQVVIVEYDGTNFQMISPLPTQQIQNNAFTYAADSVGTDSYAITVAPAPTAYATGQKFIFKAGTPNTGAATLNVNALGAKTIKKNLNVDLGTGDILSGQMVEVLYDGTNFQMIAVFYAPTSFITTTSRSSNASGTEVIAHGLGKIPTFVRVYGAPSSGGTGFFGSGSYNGTTTTGLWLQNDNASAGTSYVTGFINVGTYGSNPSPSSQSASVAFDATNITLTWTKVGGGVTGYQFAIEVFA